MLGFLIWAAGQAPFVQLWPQMLWQRHAAHLGMLSVCLIMAWSIARPNPFSFGGARNGRYDPSAPGVTRYTRHPVLLALALWAGVHLLPNGDLAHIIMFGVLGGFAIAGRRLIDRRKARILGTAKWQALDAARRAAPLIQAPRSPVWLVIRTALGGVAFATLLWAHPYVIGVTAL